MKDSLSTALNRILGVVWVVVGLGTLLLALVREPIADWGAWNLILGALLAGLALVLQLTSGVLTTGDILGAGIWLGIIASMIGVLVEANSQVARADAS